MNGLDKVSNHTESVHLQAIRTAVYCASFLIVATPTAKLRYKYTCKYINMKLKTEAQLDQ
jgi:hypothetical protein